MKRRWAGDLAGIPATFCHKIRAAVMVGAIRLRSNERDRLSMHSHSTPVHRTAPLEQRFWARVSIDPSGCWLWTGSVSNTGYGQLGKQADGKNIVRNVHRISYEINVGPIPQGLQLDHLCCNKLCVRPDHLEAVSARENSRRALVKPRCTRGHLFTRETTYIRPNGRRMCRICAQLMDFKRGRRKTLPLIPSAATRYE